MAERWWLHVRRESGHCVALGCHWGGGPLWRREPGRLYYIYSRRIIREPTFLYFSRGTFSRGRFICIFRGDFFAWPTFLYFFASIYLYFLRGLRPETVRKSFLVISILRVDFGSQKPLVLQCFEQHRHKNHCFYCVFCNCCQKSIGFTVYSEHSVKKALLFIAFLRQNHRNHWFCCVLLLPEIRQKSPVRKPSGNRPEIISCQKWPRQESQRPFLVETNKSASKGLWRGPNKKIQINHVQTNKYK